MTIFADLMYSIMTFIALFYQFLIYREMKIDKTFRFWFCLVMTCLLVIAGRTVLGIELRWYGIGGCVLTIIAVVREMLIKAPISPGLLAATIGLNFIFWPQSAGIVLFHAFHKKLVADFTQRSKDQYK